MSLAFARRVRAWSVTLLGVLLLAVTLSHFLLHPLDVSGLLEVVVPVANAFVVAGFGVFVAQRFRAGEVARIAAWGALGTLAFAWLGAWSFYLDLQHGGEFSSMVATVMRVTSAGAVAGVVVGRYDVRQRENHQQLAEREQQVQTVLDNVPVILFEFEPDGTVTLSEGRGLEAIGLTPGELVGESMFEVYAGMPEIVEACRAAADGEEIHTTVQVGDAVLESWLDPIVEDGEVTSVIGATIDVTERAEHEQQLESIHEASRQLNYVTDPEEVAELVVSIAERVLDKPVSTMWRYEEARDELVPVARTESTQQILAEADIESLSPIRRGSLGMEVYESGESCLIEDYSQVENRSLPDVPLGTVFIVPIEDYGILEVGQREVDNVTDFDRHHAQILALNARAALTRAERERELQEMQARFRALTENSPVGIVTIDADSRVEFASDALEDILGYAPEDLEGEPLTTIIPERLRDAHREGIRRYLETGERELDWGGIELRALHADGHEIDVGVSFGELDIDGEHLFTGLIRDISDRKRQERQIRGLQESTISLVDATTAEEVASLAVDIAREALDQPYTSYWSYEPGEGQLVPAAATEQVREFLGAQGFEEVPPLGPESVEMETFRDGEIRVIEEYGSLETGVGLPLGTVVLAAIGDHGLLAFGSLGQEEVPEVDRDLVNILTRTLTATFDRVERERTLAELNDATREMMQASDPGSVCERTVDAGKRTLGLSATAVWMADEEGRLQPTAWTDRTTDLIDELPTFAGDVDTIFQAVFEEGEPRLYSDLETVEEYERETPIRSAMFVPIGDYGVLNAGSTDPNAFDETDLLFAQLLAANAAVAIERATREQELETRTDQMEFFNSILRHDVLNGMTVIQARAEMLVESDALDEEERQFARTIVDWCEDITDIVGRVRTVLETLTGETDRTFSPVDLSGITTREATRVAETYPVVDFQTDIEPGVEVIADELLSEIVGNLVTNAVEHNELEGLTVRVEVEKTDGWASLRVADDGQGIPEERREVIFRRGETGHAKRTGSGFGLFFVDTMVEAYGGEVEARDNEMGGATFEVRLPTPSTPATEHPSGP